MQKMPVDPLTPDRLRVRCAPEIFNFETTGDLEDLDDFVGQPRAQAALDFGIGMRRDGYHLFAMGESGTGKHRSIRRFLEKQAAREAVPQDICYVNNFSERHQPRVLMLDAGSGKSFARNVENLIEDVRNALRVAFESEDFQNRRQSVDQELQEKQQEASRSCRRWPTAKIWSPCARRPGS
jgi:hypothetical protein